jgi:hypothetical protein
MKLTGVELKEIVSRMDDGDTFAVFIFDIYDANNAIQTLTNDENESVDSTEWNAVCSEINRYGDHELEQIFEEAIRANVSRDY